MSKPHPNNPRSDSPEARRNEPLYRDATIEFTRGKDGGESSMELAISSETGVERYDWWEDERYIEILDHSRDAIDLSYSRDGLPLLLDHSTREHVGLLSGVRLDDDKKLRGEPKFSRSQRGQEVKTDVEDGIRKKVSVGYRVMEWKLEQPTLESRGLPVRRATRWMPMEASLVAIPADYSVGVGRGAVGAAPVVPISPEPTTAPKADQQERRMAEAESAAPKATGPSAEDIRKDMLEIVNLGREYNMVDQVDGWLSRSMSPDAVRREIMDKQRKAAKPTETPAGHIDLTPREHQQYNLARAINNVANAMQSQGRFDGIEREASDEIAKRLGKSPRGLFVPLNVQKPYVDLSQRASVTGQTAGTSSLGGAGVQTDILSLIDLLRNRLQVRALGAQVLTGLSNNISFPRQITANTFNWTGENPSSANTLGNATFDNVTLTPKTGMVSTAYSRQLLLQSSFDVSSFVANDIAAVNALGVDLAAIEGTGASNQPTGIYTTTNVTAITLGTDGAALTWANIVNFETTVANNNADIGTMGFLTSPAVRGKLKTTLRSTTAGSQYIWADDNTMNGYRSVVSNQIKNNYTTGTSTTVCSGMIFGVWSELIIGEFGGAMELIVDPYSYAGQNMIAVHSVLMVDLAVKHPKAFAFTKQILTA